jgi:hypothetical protein
MALQEFLIQNAGGNCFVSVNGVPVAGASLWSQPYNGGPAQQWIPAEYPGNDPSKTGGVVCALYSGGTGGTPNLVITASSCGAGVKLQPFQSGNLNQLWAYQGTGKQSTFLNLGSGCMLDMQSGQCNGGRIQTYASNGTSAQNWKTIPVAEAAARAASFSNAGELEGAGA